jgi:hypothetical protein
METSMKPETLDSSQMIAMQTLMREESEPVLLKMGMPVWNNEKQWMQDTINSLGTLHGDTLTATKFQLRMRK